MAVTYLAVLLSLLATAFSAVCPEPFEAVGDQCYYFSTSELEWQEARDFCKTLSAENTSDLAVFDLACEDYRRIFLHVANQGYLYFWIGGSDLGHEGYWTWIDGRPIDLTASYWDAAEPEASMDYNCLVMSPQTEYISRWRLRDNGCNSVRYFVCQLGINAN
ncbi:hypothetical protein SK128_026760 [Halocaridina rubra]|uniref:C-type lectin domain-containing protein n=1 Tax=Halocaridina rubra TaxID=373956 RepID=A0AAN8XMZ7_HALRR